jgi:hypothetical protein
MMATALGMDTPAVPPPIEWEVISMPPLSQRTGTPPISSLASPFACRGGRPLRGLAPCRHGKSHFAWRFLLLTSDLEDSLKKA